MDDFPFRSDLVIWHWTWGFLHPDVTQGKEALKKPSCICGNKNEWWFPGFYLKASLSKVRKSSFMKEDSRKLWSFILLRKIFRTSLCKTGSLMPATWFSCAQSPQQVSGMECNLFGIHRGIEEGEGNKILGRKWVNVQHNFPVRIIISLFFRGEQHMTRLNSYWGKSVSHSLLIFILGLTLDHSPSKL